MNLGVSGAGPCTRVCEEKFSVFDQNFVQNKGPPKRNLGFKIRGQTEKNLRQGQPVPGSTTPEARSSLGEKPAVVAVRPRPSHPYVTEIQRTASRE